MQLDLGNLVIIYMVLLFSLCIHEFAHAWAAYICGDDTAMLMGRMTLNPVAHVDPIGTVIFPLLAMVTGSGWIFGWAKPVPVNPARFRDYRRDDIMVSLAGIASNLLLALIAASIIRTIVTLGGIGFGRALLPILVFMMRINILLAVFNLIPIPPLDGSHLLYHYLPPETARKFQRLEQYGFIILILFLMTGVFGVIMYFPLQIFRFIAGI